MVEPSKRYTPPKEKDDGYDLPPPPTEAQADGNGQAPPPEANYVLGPEGVVWDAEKNIPAPEGSKVPAFTAFVVVLDKHGGMWATPDLTILDKVSVDRPAGMQDFIPACSQIISDVNAQKTVGMTVNAMMQTSAAIAEQQRTQAMAQKLASKGIHLPGR